MNSGRRPEIWSLTATGELGRRGAPPPRPPPRAGRRGPDRNATAPSGGDGEGAYDKGAFRQAATAYVRAGPAPRDGVLGNVRTGRSCRVLFGSSLRTGHDGYGGGPCMALPPVSPMAQNVRGTVASRNKHGVCSTVCASVQYGQRKRARQGSHARALYSVFTSLLLRALGWAEEACTTGARNRGRQQAKQNGWRGVSTLDPSRSGGHDSA